jgi:hypothetical protein
MVGEAVQQSGGENRPVRPTYSAIRGEVSWFKSSKCLYLLFGFGLVAVVKSLTRPTRHVGGAATANGF